MTDKIRLVCVLTSLNIGGTERQCLETLRGLNRERFAPHVLAFPSEGALKTSIEALNIPVTCLGFYGNEGRRHLVSYFHLVQMLWRMLQFFRHEKPHIVQTYLFWGNIWGSLVATLARVPIIVTGRRELLPPPHRKFPDTCLQRLSNRLTSAIIVNSSALKKQCLQADPLLSEKKIYIVHNGIDLKKYSDTFDRDSLKNSLNIPPDYHVVGLLANLRPVKAPQDFLHAAARVLQTFPQTVFLFIGRDKLMQPELETSAKRLHIRHAVRFTGERRDIPALLALLDVQVCTSLQEGLSNALIEGMTMQKAIVATNVGGNPELIEHKRNGLLVPPGKPKETARAIIRLLADPGLREQFGHAGRERAQADFGMERMVTQTERLYQKLLSDREQA